MSDAVPYRARSSTRSSGRSGSRRSAAAADGAAAASPPSDSQAPEPFAPPSQSEASTEPARVSLRLPAALAADVAVVAREQGVSGSRAYEILLRRALRPRSGPMVAVGPTGSPDLHHAGVDLDSGPDGPRIPDGYFVPEAVPDDPPASSAEDAPLAPSFGSVLGLAAEVPAGVPAPVASEPPGLAGEPDSRPLRLAAAIPWSSFVRRLRLPLAWAAGAMALLLVAVLFRFGIVAGGSGPGSYVLDRWTGAVSFCAPSAATAGPAACSLLPWTPVPSVPAGSSGLAR